MTSARIRGGWRLFPAACAVALVGCQIDFSGLDELFDPNPTFLSLPGRRLAKGRFEQAGVDGTDTGGAVVLAFDTSGPAAQLAVIPFAGGQGCRAGPVSRFIGFPYSTRSGLTPFIPFVEPVAAPTSRRLHLLGSHCEEPVAPLDGSDLPFDPSWPFADPPGFLALGQGKLAFLDPWSKKTTVVATGASSVQTTQKKIWSIEAGPPSTDSPGTKTAQLVVRSYAFEELGRFGTDVTELAVTTDAQTRAVFIDQSELFVVTDELKKPERIATDACHVSFPGGWGGLGVAYYSPCAEQRLVLYGSRRRSDPGPGQSDQTFVLGGPTIGNPAIGFDGDDAVVFHVENADPTAKNGALYGNRLGHPAEHIGDTPQLTRGHAPLLSHRSDAWNVLVDVSAASRNAPALGRLVRWKPGALVKELARGVEETSGDLAIASFAGSSGDLVQLSGDAPATVLAKGVPAGGFDTNDDGAIAVVTDYDGTTGTLMLAAPDETRFEQVASGVRADGFLFIQSLNAISYLRDFDANAGVGTLGVHVIATGDTFDAGVRASEWREIGWPEPGILYVVPSGDREGIWFARLK